VSSTLTDGSELELFLDATVVEPMVEPALVVSETELVTDETGTEATFSVSLATEPAEPVTVTLTTDEEEGVDPEVVLSAETLEFDATNWDVPVDVLVTGQDDEDIDGDATVVVTATAASNDVDYEGLTADVTVTNEDDEVVVPAVAVSPTELITSEDATSSDFVVTLTTQPTAAVTVALSYTADGEGTLSASEVVLDDTNWDTGVTVTVTGVDDDVVDGDASYTIELLAATSEDLDYDGLDPNDVQVSNTDNDVTETPTP